MQIVHSLSSYNTYIGINGISHSVNRLATNKYSRVSVHLCTYPGIGGVYSRDYQRAGFGGVARHRSVWTYVRQYQIGRTLLNTLHERYFEMIMYDSQNNILQKLVAKEPGFCLQWARGRSSHFPKSCDDNFPEFPWISFDFLGFPGILAH